MSVILQINTNAHTHTRAQDIINKIRLIGCNKSTLAHSTLPQMHPIEYI